MARPRNRVFAQKEVIETRHQTTRTGIQAAFARTRNRRGRRSPRRTGGTPRFHPTNQTKVSFVADHGGPWTRETTVWPSLAPMVCT